MESFSIILDCPGQEELLGELWPKLDDFCEYEVFEYAAGKVLMVTFEKRTKIDTGMFAAIAMDFTSDRQCQADIVSGGGEENPADGTLSTEKSVVANVIQMFIDISEARGWKIGEARSEPDEKSE